MYRDQLNVNFVTIIVGVMFIIFAQFNYKLFHFRRAVAPWCGNRMQFSAMRVSNHFCSRNIGFRHPIDSKQAKQINPKAKPTSY